MLFFRQLELLKCLFQTFYFLTAMFCLCQAGVIKKRDIELNSTTEAVTEARPTILTAVAGGDFKAKDFVTTKLQSVMVTSFSTESSMELTNNEILINEAKKLLEEDDKIINKNNDTKLKAETETNLKENENNSEDNIKDIKEIIRNLENKEQNLRESSKSSAEFGNNDIKEDTFNHQTKKIDEKEKELNSHQQEKEEEENVKSVEKLLKDSDRDSVHSFENSLKPGDIKISPSSEIFTEMIPNKDTISKTDLDSNSDKNSVQKENIIEQSTEGELLKLEAKEMSEKAETNRTNFLSNIEMVSSKLENSINSGISQSLANIQIGDSKPTNKTKNHEDEITNQKENFIEYQKEKVSVKLDKSEQIQSTGDSETSFKQNDIQNKIKDNFTENSEILADNVKTTTASSEMSINENKNSINLHDSIEGEINNFDITAITLKTPTDMDLAIDEGSKNQHVPSIRMENSSSEKPFTTVKPVVLSIKEGIEETSETGKKVFFEKENSQNSLTLKEKKPKFINDNSTNAQQLNLPNNPEVWSLAAMKTLPKPNTSLDTTQAHTETFKEYEAVKGEDEQQRTAPHNFTSTTMMSNISEKNLLDWSQIMMDKELSTTTGNKEYTQENANHLEMFNSTFSKINFEEESEQNVSTTSATTTLATILSFTNDDNNSVTDKKVEENMNNHIELLKVTQETTTKNSNTIILPLNATLNTEPNFREKINLTLKQNTIDEPIVNATTTTTNTKNVAGKQTVDDEKTSAIASTTPTEATAVDMTTVVVEKNSSETTTVSTLGTSKQNTTLNSDDDISPPQKINNFNKNISEFKDKSIELSHSIENTLKENQTNNDFNLKLITETSTTIPTTTVVPITTFRPSILAITSTTSSTSTAATFEQEIDQNGNEIKINLNENKQIQKQQSILAETTTTATIDKKNLHNVYSSPKAIETHLQAKQYETTTLETFTESTTSLSNLIEKEAKEEDINSEINTSFSNKKEEQKDNGIFSVSIGSELDKTVITETTPKSDDETTIGSPVVSTTAGYNEKVNKKEFEIETTTAAVFADSTKTPVVVIETQSVITELEESSTTTAATTSTSTEESVIENTTRAIQQQESEIKTKTEDNETITEKNVDKNEILTTITPGMSKLTTFKTTATEETTKATENKTMATAKDEETFISLLDDITTTTAYSPISTIETITSSTPTTSTNTPQTLLSTSTTATTSEPSAITTKIEEIYNVIHSTSTEFIQTTTSHLDTEIEKSSSTTTTITSFYPTTSSSSSETIPLATTTTPSSTQMIATSDISKSLPTLTSIMGGNSGNMYPKNTEASNETDVNVIIAITVSVIGVIALILLVGFLYIMRKRQKQTSYSQRCRPVSLDEYTIDNVSVGGSMRKSSALRSSKRTYGNLAFDDPSLRHNSMGVHELAKFVQEKLRIFEEFRDVPQITSRLDEVPPGCEDKNRYANVLPLPETRVILQRLNNDDKTEYINANYVTGPKDPPNYYIACQAPLDSTVEDFWRMIWEQQSRVIIQATDLIENGIEKCAEYLPPSVTLDNHSTFGDFQITLQNREVKDKYAISTILLKNIAENVTRELTHYWYKWPEVGVPTEEAPIIAMLLEARSSLISYAIEQANEDKEKSSTATLRSAEEGTASSANGSTTSPANNSNGSSANGSSAEINGNISMVQIKKTARNQGPLTVHCSPGTGRTGTIIACDIAIRSLETPKRTVDIPQIVYYVRRGRASAVLTKEQYEFIYKVANMYAAKISNPTSYN